MRLLIVNSNTSPVVTKLIAHAARRFASPGTELVFATELEEAGMNVKWVPFDGGHEIPAMVVVALNHFLGDLSEARLTTGARLAHTTAARCRRLPRR